MRSSQFDLVPISKKKYFYLAKLMTIYVMEIFNIELNFEFQILQSSAFKTNRRRSGAREQVQRCIV